MSKCRKKSSACSCLSLTTRVLSRLRVTTLLRYFKRREGKDDNTASTPQRVGLKKLEERITKILKDWFEDT